MRPGHPEADPGAARIAPIDAAELPLAIELLARAFRDNPLNAAVVGRANPARRLRCNRCGMRPVLPMARARGQLLGLREAGRLAAALVGALPGGYPLPAAPLAARLRCLLGQGWRVARRWSEVFEALDALHPPLPHAYLGTLGVAPERQGRGLGSALLARWLARIDGDPTPVYLETDRRENIAFYARAGFEVVGETRIFGAAIWCMLRPARSRQNP